MTLDPALILADATSAPSRDALAEVSQLAARQIELEDAISATEDRLKELKEDLARVRDTDLPLALSEHGLSEISMLDGSKVKVQDIVRASITAANSAAAFSWLDAHGFGDLIKHEIKASFGRGEAEVAEKAIAALLAAGAEPEGKRSVHPQTLSAFVREQLEAGVDIPRDLLGVFVGRSAKITRAK